MHSRKLIDWVKSEGARGLSDNQLRKTLLKKGWPEKDVDKAINYAHKGKVNWMPLLLLFVGTLILFFVVNSIDRGESWFAIFLFGSIITLVYSIIPYFKSNKKEWFTELAIINYISGLFALALTIFLFNFIVFIINLTNLPVTIPFVIIFVALCIIFLFYTFFFTIERVSKHFVGYFDYESYFVFKHWPFKIFNVNWKKKWTLLKYPIIVIIIGLVISGFYFNGMVVRQEESMKQLNILTVMETQLTENCLNLLPETNNLSFGTKSIISIHVSSVGDYFYPEEVFLDIDQIYYDCDFVSSFCKQKDWDYSRKLEEQVILPGGSIQLLKLDSEESQTIFVPKKHSPEQLLACPTFEQEQLKLKIVREVDEQRRTSFLGLFEKSYPKVTLWNVLDLTTETILDSVGFGLKLNLNNDYRRIINDEGGHIIHNSFYDNSSTLLEHIDSLDENIKVLYPKYLAIKPEIFNKDWVPGLGGEEYSYKDLLSWDRSWGYLFVKATPFEELGPDLTRLREKIQKESIKIFYQTKDVEESPESKAIRFKIIETLLAQALRNDCENYQGESWQDFKNYRKTCREEIIAITKSPELLE
ncbi:hypothetical protein HOE37_00055 [Candidatus Woesearchaeota archaeon]|jgi:hypothetical protein|nr:hypothetical protein [Candidatus Woesearchaeota archaeon]MBT4110229.1 hypothetical protein [Candidatus Woesearchaeota archaeon]MBT4336247.1 hypothetical protein [Candidatus Woesearchaeota archaeon]MBT4468774.1 hypothetical protein [Candidatus Woesearchaeota archaeon]MBT6744907.1 hypothetical protein [Candidatus Woesearchaeota archaeon]